MDPAEYKAMRRALGTQKDAAEALGVATNTVARRERGELPIDREAEMAMRLAVREMGVQRAT